MNNKKFAYFYTDQITEKKDGNFTQEYYKVIKVRVFNNNVDEANRKAKTLNNKLGFGKMPGGYSIGGDKLPFSQPQYYTVINCPDNTKIQPYTDQDRFIQSLIEAETQQPGDNLPVILEKVASIGNLTREEKAIKRDIKIIIMRNLSSIEKQIKKIFFTS